MPAKSQAQQKLFAIAEHAPQELYVRNKSLARPPQQTLHDFAATKRSKLPKKVHPAVDVIRNHHQPD